MAVLDILLFVIFVSLALRGWARGFVKEAMDLLGVIVGLALAFRLSGPAGEVVSGITGATSIVARLVGGLLLFTIVGAAAAFAAHHLHRVATLPGLRLGNRLTGAGLALAWGLFLATLALSMASLFSLPAAVASQVDESTVAKRLTDPRGVAQTMFTQIAGDEVVEVLLALDDLVGGRRVIVSDEEVVALEPVEQRNIDPDPDSVHAIFDLVNDARSKDGLTPLRWSPGLADAAARHSVDMYTTGFFSHISPSSGRPNDRVADSGVIYRSSGENLALAADVEEVHAGLMESPGHRANVLSSDYDRVGIAAHDGPFGLMLVEVFAG